MAGRAPVVDRNCIHCGKPLVYAPVAHDWVHEKDLNPAERWPDPRCRKNTRTSTVAEPLRRAPHTPGAPE